MSYCTHKTDLSANKMTPFVHLLQQRNVAVLSIDIFQSIGYLDVCALFMATSYFTSYFNPDTVCHRSNNVTDRRTGGKVYQHQLIEHHDK